MKHIKEWIIPFLLLPYLISTFLNTHKQQVELVFLNQKIESQITQQNTSKYNVMNILKELRNLPLSEKQQTVLFIPQSNATYWNAFHYCKYAPFIAPAIAEIAMIDGLPEANCLVEDYGYQVYHLRTTAQTPQDTTPAILCKKAIAKGFSKLIIIEGADTTSVRKISCYHNEYSK